MKVVNLQKSSQFNKYLEPQITKETAARDAKEFIETCAKINGETVCLDEWLFGFAKLLYCNKDVFDKFIEDYYVKVEKFGTFREVIRVNMQESAQNPTPA